MNIIHKLPIIKKNNQRGIFNLKLITYLILTQYREDLGVDLRFVLIQYGLLLKLVQSHSLQWYNHIPETD